MKPSPAQRGHVPGVGERVKRQEQQDVPHARQLPGSERTATGATQAHPVSNPGRSLSPAPALDARRVERRLLQTVVRVSYAHLDLTMFQVGQPSPRPLTVGCTLRTTTLRTVVQRPRGSSRRGCPLRCHHPRPPTMHVSRRTVIPRTRLRPALGQWSRSEKRQGSEQIRHLQFCVRHIFRRVECMGLGDGVAHLGATTKEWIRGWINSHTPPHIATINHRRETLPTVVYAGLRVRSIRRARLSVGTIP